MRFSLAGQPDPAALSLLLFVGVVVTLALRLFFCAVSVLHAIQRLCLSCYLRRSMMMMSDEMTVEADGSYTQRRSGCSMKIYISA